MSNHTLSEVVNSRQSYLTWLLKSSIKSASICLCFLSKSMIIPYSPRLSKKIYTSSSSSSWSSTSSLFTLDKCLCDESTTLLQSAARVIHIPLLQSQSSMYLHYQPVQHQVFHIFISLNWVMIHIHRIWKQKRNGFGNLELSKFSRGEVLKGRPNFTRLRH